MRSYTGGYTQALRQFVIQNLPGRVEHEFTPVLKIALNILQRGNPTQPAAKLIENLGIDDLASLNSLPEHLLPGYAPEWTRTILGDDESDWNPAWRFFHEVVPSHIDPAAAWLLIPEAEIGEILQKELGEFTKETVDFYIPDAYFCIEIDGSQHQVAAQATKDRRRDRRLSEHRVKTIRIPATDLRSKCQKSDLIERSLEAIREVRASYRTTNELGASQRIALRAVAAFRLQVVLLELMLCQRLPSDGTPWRLVVECVDTENFTGPAVEDLLDLVGEVATLHSVRWARPSAIHIASKCTPGASAVVIDIASIARWTDENQTDKDRIFVRSGYADHYPDKYLRSCAIDHFRVECSDALLTQLDDDQAHDPLLPVLKRLFSHEDFRPGQRAVLVNALGHEKTIGILPTGQGKSLCYQYAALAQPGVTVVISPLKSLMRDQIAEMQKMGISRVAAINSEDSANEKKMKMAAFATGTYQILLISPERFQVPEFRDVCLALTRYKRVHHAVVDEVHCLSEWGHDFRIAYLNLAKTVASSLPRARFIGLTATASANVITDIRSEFNVDDEDVLYRLDLRRTNLRFQVRIVPTSQVDSIKRWVNDRVTGAPGPTPVGIIFTPYVNGSRGCFSLANKLQAELEGVRVAFFSGTKPRHYSDSKRPFDQYKQRTQDTFKSGQLDLLCATKAFGMGVNKRNVRYTAHLGVPSSMEALYQEAGRAGRDGLPADCIVFASPPDKALHAAFRPSITPKALKHLVTNAKRDSDLKAQLFLITSQLSTITEDFVLTQKVLSTLTQQDQRTVIDTGCLAGLEIVNDKASALQRAIYRLRQLGYVSDWTVRDFIRGIYAIDLAKPTEQEVVKNLIFLVRKYSGARSVNSLEDICGDDETFKQWVFTDPPRPIEDVALLLLLIWSYNHFHYARRQSMKTVFELCESYDELGEQGFRESLEAFFQIDSRTNKLYRFIDAGIELIDEWEDILFGGFEADARHVTNQLWVGHLATLQGMISRLLESFRNNLALDVLSGLVRLLRGKYQDQDGRERLRSHLEDPRLTRKSRWQLRDLVLRVAQSTSAAERELLAEDLLSVFRARVDVSEIHGKLQDKASLVRYAELLSADLRKINGRFINGFEAY